MKVYLDNGCYNRPYDDQTQRRISLETQAKLHVQEMIRKDELELVVSFINTYELSQSKLTSRRETIMEYVRDNASEFINSDDGGQIKRRAEEIMKTGIKMKDAYHIACAERAGCDYLLTTDDRFLKYKTEDIYIINPIDFVLLLEGN